MDGAPEWAAADPLGARDESGSGGFAQVLLARRMRASKVTVCGFLVDVYCLGVKTVIGPRAMGVDTLDAFVNEYYTAFDDPAIAIGLTQAQRTVHGAVAYARGLGFAPPTDFEDAASHLGEPPSDAPEIRFGRDGKPYYISGPYDHPAAVLRQLETTCGPGNYDYLTRVGPRPFD
jgi:hypothetical protein